MHIDDIRFCFSFYRDEAVALSDPHLFRHIKVGQNTGKLVIAALHRV